VAGEDPATLREIARRVEDLLRAAPNAERVRDSWGTDNFTVNLRVDPDRANLAGVTNLDVARSSASARNGAVVGTLHEGDHQRPIVARLRASERQQLSDRDNLYVYAASGGARVPLRQIADLDYAGVTAKILRRNHVRTITVAAFPVRPVSRLPVHLARSGRTRQTTAFFGPTRESTSDHCAALLACLACEPRSPSCSVWSSSFTPSPRRTPS
jgi:multidrug efflux pump subunit AcrB